MRKNQDLRRRKPKQARAQATVDSILEAAAQVLERTGPDGLNTNRVAERAGVSVGTLYQYFPDKETILLAVARRALDKPDAGFAGLQKALMEALARALESFLGRGIAPANRPARVRVKTGRNPRPNRLASLVSDAVMAWVIPPLVTPRALPIAAKRRAP